MSIPFRRDDAADGEQYTCDECSESFPDVYAFTDHMLRLNGPGRRFACNVCWRTFSHQMHLKEHAVVHHDESKHKCDRCSKSLSSARNLRRHVSQVHDGGGGDEKTYECDASSKRLSVANRRKDHAAARRCGAVRPQSFANSGSLKKHEVLHGNEKKFKCPVCFDTFARSRTLNYHFMNYHLLPNLNVNVLHDKQLFAG